MSLHVDTLPYACGAPLLTGVMKREPGDFCVDEVLGFELDGAGEHCCIHLRATGQNTEYCARVLARWAGIPLRQVSFSGQKDRYAVTTQWFSLHLPGQPDPVIDTLDHPGIEILSMGRHSRKLKRGTHIGNAFSLWLRDVDHAGYSREDVEARLREIARHGVPNYFGSQRFGRNDSNLQAARLAVIEQRLPRDQDKRGWIFSALRSYLFNLWLAHRVNHGSWATPIPGDILQRRGRRGFFVPETTDDALAHRLEAQELLVAGILPGDGENPMKDQALIVAQEVWQDHANALQLLQKQRVSLEVRAARLIPEDFSFAWANNDLQLKFSLPRGAFATSVVREIMAERPRSSGDSE